MIRMNKIKRIGILAAAALLVLEPAGSAVMSSEAATIYQPGLNIGGGPGATVNNTANQSSPDAGDYAATGGIAQGSMSIDTMIPLGCTDALAYEIADPIVTAKDKYSYDDMERDLNALHAKYPSYMGLSSIGVTSDGRNIYEATVGNVSAGTHILITGAIHAREYITTMLVMKQMEYMLSCTDSNGAFDAMSLKDWLNSVCIHFVPMVNPDGVAISQHGLNGLRSDALKEKVSSAYENDKALGRTTLDFEPYLTEWKANANGVNLNDNFNALTENINYKTDKPSSEVYYGTPGSEAETKALQNLVDSRHYKLVISYHATGSIIYWNYEGNKLVEHTRDISNNVKALTGYQMVTTAKEGVSFKAYLGTRMQPVTNITVEVGKSRAPVNFTEFPTIWTQNKFVPFYAMKWAKEKGK